jgi:hypothetical protein
MTLTSQRGNMNDAQVKQTPSGGIHSTYTRTHKVPNKSAVEEKEEKKPKIFFTVQRRTCWFYFSSPLAFKFGGREG